MSTRVFNLSLNSAPVPGPNFFYSRDPEGKTTGRHTFTVLRGALASSANQARFKKGTPINILDPTLSAFFAFLLVDSFSAQDLPGGFCEVSVDLKGYTEDGEFETDREVTYASNCSTVEKSMLENPKFLAAVSNKKDRQGFSMIYNALGTAEAKFSEAGELNEVEVFALGAESNFVIWTDEETLKWYEIIFIKNRRTFEAPAFEHHKMTANLGGLSNSDLNKLGKRDSSPPGGPPRPDVPAGATTDDYTWFKFGAEQQRSSSSASTGESWKWGYYPADEYE